MLLLGQLAKVQGLKGEFLFHAIMDNPDRLPDIQGLVLAPPGMDLQDAEPQAPAHPVTVRIFRWHQERPCLALQEIADRTAADAFKGWALWMPEDQASLGEGESFRHDWVGCQVLVEGQIVGEVTRLDPTPFGYDMMIMRDLRPGRSGLRDIPYIKAWFQLDLPNRQIHLDPPPGLLDLDRIKD